MVIPLWALGLAHPVLSPRPSGWICRAGLETSLHLQGALAQAGVRPGSRRLVCWVWVVSVNSCWSWARAKVFGAVGFRAGGQQSGHQQRPKSSLGKLGVLTLPLPADSSVTNTRLLWGPIWFCALHLLVLLALLSYTEASSWKDFSTLSLSAEDGVLFLFSFQNQRLAWPQPALPPQPVLY